MKAYIYQAALLCEDCGKIQQSKCRGYGRLNNEDSDHFPQGPYSDGGGEADSPNHCDSCGLFLENPLTTDGEEYVREELRRYTNVNHIARKLWASFYDIAID